MLLMYIMLDTQSYFPRALLQRYWSRRLDPIKGTRNIDEQSIKAI